MQLTDDIRLLRGIGEKKAQAFHKLGVFSLSDLLSFFPRRYEDRSTVRPITETLDGETVCIEAIVADNPVLNRIRRGLEIVKFRAADETGTVDISYFNQPYVRQQLRRGETYRFYGKMELRGSRRSMTNPDYELSESQNGQIRTTGRILPVYRLCADLNRKAVLQAVRQTLDSVKIPEILPESVRKPFLSAAEAYESIHFPESFEMLAAARRRLVFEELFVLSCTLSLHRNSVQAQDRSPAASLSANPDFEPFYQTLPFAPTKVQRRAIAECAEDMCSGKHMNRLLQGDVGSGKTLVAAALIWFCARSGRRSAFMAPTQILAEQHFHTLCSLLEPFGLKVGLYTAAQKTPPSDCDVLVGTHALLNVEIPDLALAITDEQHRFGVSQRSRLSQGGEIHMLVMSATPIPRTLSLIIYGDLDISVLDELPPGRKPVDTFCVDSRYYARLLAFIRRLCAEGRQVYVVCPKVESDIEEDEPLFSSDIPLHSAVDYAAQLQAELPELTVGCVHGRMKAQEKDAVMRAFSEGSLQVLVSTTVIEVGVDVPNAALMLVENAERFGLSQLHQLRGRVGRGSFQSYCVLVTDHGTEDTAARMRILCETNDGFRIAEEDLRLRGPGDFFGSRQHGLPELHIADLGTDANTLQEAKAAADALLLRDPKLETCPQLRERAELLLFRMDGAMN